MCNEAHWVITYNLLHMFLNSICKNFAENFYICSLKKLVGNFLTVAVSLPGLRIRIILNSQDEFGSAPSFSDLWNKSREIGMRSFLKV